MGDESDLGVNLVSWSRSFANRLRCVEVRADEIAGTLRTRLVGLEGKPYCVPVAADSPPVGWACANTRRCRERGK